MSVDIIQADYDQLDAIASRFGQQVDTNTALLNRLNQTVDRLRGAGWEGQAADTFFAEMDREIFPAMRRLTTALEQGQAVTLKSSAIMRQAEEEAAEPFRKYTDIGGIFGNSPSAKNRPVGGGSTPFDWWDFGDDVTGQSLDYLIGWAKKVPDSSYKSIGRLINAFIGNKRGGWVGRMDELADFIKKNPIADALGELVSVPFGIREDLSEGDSWQKAITTELVEAGVLYGGRKLLYAVPYVGQAMMIYDGAMFAGNLIAGGMEAVGLHEQAVWLQNTLDTVDIDRYIGEGIDWAYDRVAPVVSDVAGDLIDAGAGFIEDAGNVAGQAVDGIKDFFGF